METGLPIDEQKSADHALSCRSIPAKLIPAILARHCFFMKTEMGERSGSTEGPCCAGAVSGGGGGAGPH